MQSGIALEDVHILNLKDSSSVISNKNGEFILTQLGTYKFSSLGYESQTITFNDFKPKIIQLIVEYNELQEVVVHGSQLPLQLKKSVTTVNIISQEEIHAGNSYNLAPIINKVPGIYMHNGALNTNRITIRGIGSRNLFGTAKIRAYFEDIPLTTGNGETTIEDFELNSIARLEIVKGANSSMYGAGLGGTIHLIPKKAYLDTTAVSSEFTFGSFGLLRGSLSLEHGDSKNSFNALYSNTHSDGYRDNNQYDRQTITFTSNHFINKKNEISFVGSYIDLKGFIPSSLNAETFENNPTEAAFTWASARGFEDTKRGVFGISWKHDYNENLAQSTSVFSSFRNGYEPRPFNILSEDTFAIGIRSRLLGNLIFLGHQLDWTFGGEFFNDIHTSKTFANLFRDFPDGTGSVQGELLSNFKENRRYINLFFEGNYEITDKLLLSTGLNFNTTSYNLDDRFITDKNDDQSGNYSFESIFSPKIGLSYELTDKISFYSSVSHGFSPPTISETLLPDGQINTAIQPETGWNFELGTRGYMFNKKLVFNATIFRLDVRNLLVARRTSEDQFIGINAGKTQHDGLEVLLNYTWLNSNTISIDSYLNYTLNDFIFKDFIDEEQNFSGNKLTGVPSEILNTGLSIQSKLGVYSNINFQYVGRIPITDGNTLFSDAYKLANIKLGYKTTIGKKISLDAFLGIDNLFDEKYASQILINASSFGGNAPRYFYPGNPSNYYSGIQLNYIF